MPRRLLRSRGFQRVNRLLRHMYLALGILFLVTLLGTAGFVWIAGYPPFDAFYMTIITLSTVGYGEIHPLGPEGRLFASALIIFNLLIFTYAVTSLTSFLAEGNVARALAEYRMQNKLDALSGHVIVCGYGRIGRQVVTELQRERHRVVVVDQNLPETEAVPAEAVLRADVLLDTTLRDAGLDRAAALVAALPKDADNLLLVLTARELNPGIQIVSRVSAATVEPRMRHAGATHVVLPERVGGRHMAHIISRPDIVQFTNLLSEGSGDAVLHEITCAELRPDLRQQPLAHIHAAGAQRVILLALHTPAGMQVNPDHSHRLAHDEALIVLGSADQVAAYHRQLTQAQP